MKWFALFLLFVATHACAVKDDYGNDLRLREPARRIVSLAPHLTELLYDAGAGPKLVGAIEYSDFPPAARALPRVGNDAGISLEAVLALKPDLIVAWPNVGSRPAIDRLAALGLPVFRSEPRELEDIPRTLERLGALAGTEAQADQAAAEFRARLEALTRKYAMKPGEAPVRVFYEVWDRPLQTVNGQHIISKVIRLCGGENVFAGLPLIAPEIDAEAVLKADPEVIVAGDVNGARPAALDRWKAFPGLLAAAKNQLYALPPDLMERHTPRLLEGARRLCGLLDRARAAR